MMRFLEIGRRYGDARRLLVMAWLVGWPAAIVLTAWLAAAPASAQTAKQPAGGSWQTGVERGAAPKAEAPAAGTDSKAAAGEGPPASVTLQALLTDNGQRIEQGIVWRIFEGRAGPDGKNKLISMHREAAPSLKLASGEYLVNAAFGRAQHTRKIAVKAGASTTERVVLNAGGLRLTAYVGTKGTPAPASSVLYDILSDERDQFGQRVVVMSKAKPGLIIRLNSGIYQVVSTLGDANATVTADITVEPGKLTEAAVAHAAAKATFKLVAKPGGEALADTHWQITTPQGEVVKESAGALPTHTLLPGDYIATARSGDRIYKRAFRLQMDETAQVEVVMQ